VGRCGGDYEHSAGFFGRVFLIRGTAPSFAIERVAIGRTSSRRSRDGYFVHAGRGVPASLLGALVVRCARRTTLCVSVSKRASLSDDRRRRHTATVPGARLRCRRASNARCIHARTQAHAPKRMSGRATSSGVLRAAASGEGGTLFPLTERRLRAQRWLTISMAVESADNRGRSRPPMTPTLPPKRAP
jgi:hypothetical protein